MRTEQVKTDEQIQAVRRAALSREIELHRMTLLKRFGNAPLSELLVLEAIENDNDNVIAIGRKRK